ncbi:MAG: Spy/CpxP family protein refolding chaperone [Calditrichaeota bacterium]|jgi:Spy/CpxP family protein refolding chaperone|nr:Spy/CpxP family protein refolding chaperone [Calditrichota bacterium]MBT7618817.1 Spy/CpxP family protein refolding chaperone [Calditrichota bacterium]
MKRILTLTIVLSLLIVSAGFAQPHGFGKGGKMGPGHGGPGMMGEGGRGCDQGPMMGHGSMKGCMKGLDLNEKQQAKFQKMGRDHQRAMLELKTESAGTHDKVKLLLTADKFDKKTADALANKMGELNTKRMQMKFAHVREMRDLLTPEQQIKFDKKILSKGGHRGGEMGMHGKQGMKMKHKMKNKMRKCD